MGAFTGHYETLVRYCQQQVAGLPPKFLAATATIEGVDHQSRHLYGLPARRFPERGYQRWESFYTTLSRTETGEPQVMRRYVAFRSHYMNPTEGALLCLEILHDEIRRLYNKSGEAVKKLGLRDAVTIEAVRELLHYYDTTLTYVGSKAAGTRVEKILDEDIGKRLPRAGDRELAATFLSGQSSLVDIHRAVQQLEQPSAWNDAGRLDALVATSVISHGVDVERFNLMVLNGLPGRIEEYIQTSSRSGRRRVGLVIVVFSPWSTRDHSIYHRFAEHHRNLERLVSPVPINRFAKFVIRRTLPGIVAGLVMGCYVPRFQELGLKRTQLLLKALDGVPPFGELRRLKVSELYQAVCSAYALDEGRYEQGLETAMKADLQAELGRQLRSLRASDEALIYNALTQKPMTSLRDVDRPVAFSPDLIRTSLEQLAWFSRRPHSNIP